MAGTAERLAVEYKVPALFTGSDDNITPLVRKYDGRDIHIQVSSRQPLVIGRRVVVL